MSFCINTVAISGGLVTDCAEHIKTSANGNVFGTIPIGFSTSRKDQQGQWIEESHYVDVKVFGKTAEFLGQHGRKGMPIAVQGELRQERWENKDGQKRSKLVVYARVVNLNQRLQLQTQAPPAPAPGQSAGNGGFGGDDVPF